MVQSIKVEKLSIGCVTVKKLLFIGLIGVFLIQLTSRASAEKESTIEMVQPKVVSEAAVLMDSDTGAVLYEKNGQEKMVPASLTKIATAIYAIEKGDLTDIVTVSESARNVDGTRVYLEAGEQVTLLKLVQGMLINSGNDAAWAIAEHIDGSINQFSRNLNTYLEQNIGTKNTHFTNPHGLYDEEHYTTARDLAIITNYAMKNVTFRQIFGETEMEWIGESWDTTIYTHHLMLANQYPYEWVNGGKTGFVNEAKQTLATTASNGRLNLTAIALKTDFKRDIYQDTIKMFDYGFNSYTHDFIDSNEVYQENDQTYTTNGEDIEITIPSNNPFIEELTDDGELRLFTEDGTYLQSVKLKKKQSKENISQQLKSAAPPAPENEADDKNWWLSSMLAAGAILVFYFGIRSLRRI